MSDVVPSPAESEPTPPTDDGQAPVSAVAHQVLKRRLRKAVRFVRECADSAELSPELIHQLRVAIRRVDAACATFQPLLPKRRCERVRKRLRRVRRAAGEIRDVDVLLERSLSAGADAATAGSAGRQELLDCRQRLERDLRCVARDEADDDFRRRVRQIVRRIRWRGADAEPTLATAASALLHPIAQDCLTNAAADLTAVRRLHRFRVSVKRLRYAGEFVQAGLDAAAYARLQALLVGLQQRLGGVCDHAAAIRLLDRRRDASRDQADAALLSGLIAREQASLTTRQSEFVAWWEPVGQQDFNQAVQACLR